MGFRYSSSMNRNGAALAQTSVTVTLSELLLRIGHLLDSKTLNFAAQCRNGAQCAETLPVEPADTEDKESEHEQEADRGADFHPWH